MPAITTPEAFALAERIMRENPDALNDMVFRMPRDGLWDYRKTAFEYLAPELRRHKLLPDQPWVPPAAAAVIKMFDRQHFRTSQDEAAILNCAVLMAVVHPYGLDYLKTAPILLIGFRHHRIFDPMNEQGRAHMASVWVDYLDRRPKLRTLMDRFELAYPLRALKPGAIELRYRDIYSLFWEEGVVSPSELAQAIPAEEQEQRAWLDALKGYLVRIRAFCGPNAGQNWRDYHINWAARALAETTLSESAAGDLADFVYANHEIFNPRWDMKRALDEAVKWHNRLAMRSTAGPFETQHGIPFDKKVTKDDGAPDEFYVDVPYLHKRFVFKRLCSGLELWEEGRAMHHCVASYSNALVSGSSAFYSLQLENGERLATLQYDRDAEYEMMIPPLVDDR
jgi:hypothetical protein